MTFEPQPLPGTHLAEVDCIDCGAIVLAVPAYADKARCAACGREFHGAIDGAAPARGASPDQ